MGFTTLGIVLCIMWFAFLAYAVGDPAPIRVTGLVYLWLDAPPGSNSEIHISSESSGVQLETFGRTVVPTRAETITFQGARMSPGVPGLNYSKYQSNEFSKDLYAKPVPAKVTIKVELPEFQTATADFSPKAYEYMSVSIAVFLVKNIDNTSAFKPPLPPTPQGFVATLAAKQLVYLTWQNTDYGEDGFRIERARDSGFSWDVVNIYIASGESLYIDRPIYNNTEYWYRLVSFNSTGDSETNPVIHFRTLLH